LLPSGRVYPVINANGAFARTLQIRNGARLTLNSGFNINVCGSLDNLGTFTTNPASTVTFIGNSNPAEIKGNLSGLSTLGSVVINKTNATDSVKLVNNTDLTGDFTITRGQFKGNGFNMRLAGNFSNAGAYIHNNTTLELNGASNSTITNTGTGNFHTLRINKTAGGNTVTFNPAVTTIQNQLNLTSGKAVTIGTNEISVTNSATSAVINHSAISYVQGRIRRSVSGTGGFDFPVGDATRYQLISMSPTTSLTGTSNILGYFNGSTAGGSTPILNEGLYYYQYVCQNGFWTLTPNAQPSAGAFNININPIGFVCQGPYQTIGKRTNSGTAWTFGGSTPVGFTQRNGYTSFSEFAQIDAEQPLPIKLLSFYGKWRNKVIELNWNTASERDNDYFLLERSADGTYFETIGKIDSKNEIKEANNYKFDDHNPGSGLNIYRLKQYDTDGKFNYSHAITLTKNGAADFVKLLPNPISSGQVSTIQILASEKESYQILVVDMAGKTLIRKQLETTSGLNEIELSPKNILPKGIYTVHFIGLNQNSSDHLPLKLVVE